MRFPFLVLILFLANPNFGLTISKPDSLLHLLSLSETKEEQLHLYLKLANEYFESDNDDSCIVFLNRLKKELNPHRNPLLAGGQLFIDAKLLYKNEHYEKAIPLFNQSLLIYEKLKDSTQISACCNYLGICHELLSDFTKALPYYQNAFLLDSIRDDTFGMSRSLTNIGDIYYSWGKYEKAFACYTEGLNFAQSQNNFDRIAIAKTNIGRCYNIWGKYDSALSCFEFCLALDIEKGNDRWVSVDYNNIGYVYECQGDYSKAYKYYQQALEINKEFDFKTGVAFNYSCLGKIHKYWKDYEKAIAYYTQSLIINIALDYTEGVANDYRSIGDVYYEQKEYDKAYDVLFKAYGLLKEINEVQGYVECTHDLGNVLLAKGYIEKAMYYLNESLQKSMDTDNKYLSVKNYIALSTLYLNEQDYNTSIKFAQQALSIASVSNLKLELSKIYENLAYCYEHLGENKKALDNYKLFHSLSDSVFNEKKLEAINQMEFKYSLQIKEKQIQLQQSEISQHKAELKHKTKSQRILLGGIIVAIVLLFNLFLVYMQKRKTYKLNLKQKEDILIKNNILEQNREEMTMQNENLHLQNEQILCQQNDLIAINNKVRNSINYAERIQRSMLPDKTIFKNCFNDNFIFYKPRDVVSGDFYWFKQIENTLILAVADCTGHGVPGAFMSVLGISFLNDIFSKRAFNSPNLVLEEMRERIKIALKQTGTIGETRDGMDMALVYINTKTKALEFSGAYNPIFIIRNNELIEIKGDRQPLAIYEKEKTFTKHDFQLQNGDNLYLFTDGYADQFGGIHQKKYMTARLKKFLMGISGNAMSEQGILIEENLARWRGSFEQMDDLLMIGLRI